MSSDLPISVLIPVKNDAENLRVCLEKLRGFDDIWVIDSQSQDNTADICAEFDVQRVDFLWNGQYPKKRNWALKNVSFRYEWILLLDADERVTPAFIDELKGVLKQSPYSAYWVSYQNFFMARKIRGDRFQKIALIRKGQALYERIDESRWSHLDMEVHEHPLVEGQIGTLRAALDHFDFRGLEKYMEKHLQYASWEAHRFVYSPCSSSSKTFRQKMKYKLLDTWIWGPLVFVYLFILRAGFCDGRIGAIFALQKWVYFWNIKMRIEDLRARQRHLS